jgi:tetratricopeptide (TPR) repeat protein
LRYELPWGKLCLVALLVSAFSITSAQEPTADDLLKSATLAQQRGDYQAAIADYRKLLQLEPNKVEAKVNLGAALVQLGQYDEAIGLYKSSLTQVSQKAPVQLNLGLAYYKKGDFAHARDQFLALHNLQPTALRLALLLADTDLNLGKTTEAVGVLEPLAAENADNFDFQYAYGTALIEAGHPSEGVSRLEKIADANRSADAFFLAGQTRLRMNNVAEARIDLEAALRLNPQLPNIFTLVGIARDKNDDPGNAEPMFRQALQQNPDDFTANLYLGTILYKRRDLSNAKSYLDRALKLRPTDQLARYESAMLASTEGNYQAAVPQLESLTRENPQWLDPHVELAALYYKLGRKQDGERERSTIARIMKDQQSQLAGQASEEGK